MIDFDELQYHDGLMFVIVRDEDCTRIDCRTLIGTDFDLDWEAEEDEES